MKNDIDHMADETILLVIVYLQDGFTVLRDILQAIMTAEISKIDNYFIKAVNLEES